MSLAITQTFIIIVTIWLMGPNKPLLTWTLCAQIPCSLCFFSLLVWMHYATQLQFSDSKMPVLVVQQLASLERIKHYTVS